MMENQTPAKKLLQTCLVVLILGCGPVLAQQKAAERGANLRAQLLEIQTQQTDLQNRLAQIDEDIKPENIERSLAGVGSTHPEDLREARRRQLEIQRNGIRTQLDSLAAARLRLESAVAAADAESYRQLVGPNTDGVSNTTGTTAAPRHRSSHPRKRRVKK